MINRLRVLCQPTLACNLSQTSNACPYCWQEACFGSSRNTFPTRPWQDWLQALRKLPISSVIDFVGGETLHYPGIHTLIKELGYIWAITSNLGSQAYIPFVDDPLPRCKCFNVSWHPSNRLVSPETFISRANRLKERYRVVINILATAHDAEAWASYFSQGGHIVHVSPYEDMANVVKTTSGPFRCDGGLTHLTLAPNGDAYPCLTRFRHPSRANFQLSNIFSPDFALPETGIEDCTLFCEEYHILAARKGGWGQMVETI